MSRKIILTLLALFSPAAMAQFSGEAAVGYLVTGGNAQTNSLNAKLALDYADAPWKNAFLATAVNTGDALRTTAERYFVSDKLAYDFSPKTYTFVVVEYEKDLFGGIRERTSEALGVGRHLLTGPVHVWDAEIGAGARQTEANITGEKNNDVIGRFNTVYKWKISDTASFAQTLKAESGETNTLSEAVTELKLNIIGNLAAVLSYSLRHNSRVPATREKLDTTASVSLSYSFGK